MILFALTHLCSRDQRDLWFCSKDIYEFLHRELALKSFSIYPSTYSLSLVSPLGTKNDCNTHFVDVVVVFGGVLAGLKSEDGNFEKSQLMQHHSATSTCTETTHWLAGDRGGLALLFYGRLKSLFTSRLTRFPYDELRCSLEAGIEHCRHCIRIRVLVHDGHYITTVIRT